MLDSSKNTSIIKKIRIEITGFFIEQNDGTHVSSFAIEI